jgi:hypothetical protein
MDPDYWKNFLAGIIEGFIASSKDWVVFWLKAIPIGFIVQGAIWSIFGFNLWTLLIGQGATLLVWTKMWFAYEKTYRGR